MKSNHWLRRLVRQRESGQAAALIALLLFFVFLPLAALAVDGSATYLVRRDLQNVADAAALSACRVIANNDTTTTPLQAALDTIQLNLGSTEPFVGAAPPATNLGAGAALIKGIEVSASPIVRVALQRPVPTVLTQFVGRTQTLVTAQARCNATAGGGLLPIAVQRYDGAPGGTKRDYLGNKAASGYSPAPTSSCVRTQGPTNPPVPYSDDSDTVTWAGRYGPWDVPVPKSQYTASDGGVEDANTGPEVLILGQSADTNNGEPSMRDLVLLDIRNISSVNALEYYNGAYSQGDAAKDMSQNWIYQHGYPGPYPQTGSQVAILSGASNAFAAGAMQNAGYQVGDAVATIVYDGYVWTTPDFTISLTPITGNGIAGSVPYTGTEVNYTIQIAKAGSASEHWLTPQDFTLRFDFTNPLPAGTQVEVNGTLLGSNMTYFQGGVTEAGWSGTLRIWNTGAIVPAQFLTGVNLYASTSGVSHGASANYGFTVNTADFALRAESGELVVRQGDSASVQVLTFGSGGSGAFGTKNPCNGEFSNVPVQANLWLGNSQQTWSNFFTSGQNTQVDVKKDAIATVNLALSAAISATVTPFGGPPYTLRISVGPASCSYGGSTPYSGTLPMYTEDIPLTILTPAPNATPNKFVFIQGYSVFRISCVDTNDVWGYAISPLYQSYEEIRVGLRPRLVPWN